MCHQAKYPNFVHNFKIRYQARDTFLLQNECLFQFVKEDIHIHETQAKFMKLISMELTQAIIHKALADQNRSLKKLTTLRESCLIESDLAQDLMKMNGENLSHDSDSDDSELSAGEEIQ